jgi:hypothetical protein
LRPLHGEPTVLLATSTSVWEPDDARFGATRAGRALIGAPGAWWCFDTDRDPAERQALPETACADLLDRVKEGFPAAR